MIHAIRSRAIILAGVFVLCSLPCCTAAESADVETDPLVLKKLETFQDWKFGLFMHWGIYSQWGCIESWPLIEEDKWARPDDLPAWIERGKDMKRFSADYRKLNQTFNPRHFDPQSWVDAARQAGMKYVVFTTKHHDGFCMFDTRQTDFRVTAPDCPFHANRPRRRGQGRVRCLPQGRLRHRGLLLEERLASAGLLGRRPTPSHAEPQLRHGQGAGSLGELRQVHATTSSRNLSATTGRSIFSGWTAARCDRLSRTLTCRPSRPWPAGTSRV